MIIAKVSPLTGRLNTMDIDVSEAQLSAWQGGTLIQDAMPKLSAEERDFIISGSTQADWDNMFGEEE